MRHRSSTGSRRFAPFLLAGLLVWVSGGRLPSQDTPWFERESEWNGYRQLHFQVAGRAAYVVAPRRSAEGKPWVWRARFPNYHAEIDVALLAEGYHVGYVDVANLFGSPRAVKIGDEFYHFLTEKRGFATRPVLEGVSRGGLFVYNWAAQNVDRVSCIYCDTPVCDFKSWPGGKGTGLGSKEAWQRCLEAYGFTESQALAFAGNPIDHVEVFARARLPMLHIVSENDRVVPVTENTAVLRDRMGRLGHHLEVISVPEGTAQSQGHHFEHPDPSRGVEFMVRHTAPAGPPKGLLERTKRVLFLGDSITYAGHYVAFFEAWLLTQNLDSPPIVINAGLPSETVSGLSEEGHAGGKFPRPDLAERLERVLDTARADLVFACYGINCGIYQPFDEERFGRYQRGLEQLRARVEAKGAELVLITPPTYDDQRAKKSFSYDSVMARYSKWLLAQRERGWRVIDLHRTMAYEVARRRPARPDFTFQPDAVHPDVHGHWLMAQQLCRWFGDESAGRAWSPENMLDRGNHNASRVNDEVLPLVRERMTLLRDAYLTAADHTRPGLRTGLPIEEAERRAARLTAAISEIRNR